MPYARLLDELIQTSGLTAKEIARRCTEKGVDITPSYISMLRNPKNGRIPSNEVSCALAKAMGARESLLVIEGIMDTAPPDLRNAINYLKLNAAMLALSQTGNTQDESMLSRIKEEIDAQPIAYTVLEMANAKVNVDLKNTIDMQFPVNDNSLSPILVVGDTVRLETVESYSSGDIVGFAFAELSDKLLFRQIQNIDGQIWFTAFKGAEPIRFDGHKMVVLGKAVAMSRGL